MSLPNERTVKGAGSTRKRRSTHCWMLALTLGVAASAPAHPPQAARYDRAAAERYIRQASADWATSVATNDASVLKRILAEDFVWVLDGRVIGKKQALTEAAAGPGPFLSNKLDYVHIRFFGDTAVAQGRETWRRSRGKVLHGSFIWTDTWVRRGGQWQVVASQDDVIPLDGAASPE